MKKVEQFSIDIVYEEGCRPTCSEIENLLTKAGIKVAGSDYVEDLTDLYEKEYPELLED